MLRHSMMQLVTFVCICDVSLRSHSCDIASQHQQLLAPAARYARIAKVLLEARASLGHCRADGVGLGWKFGSRSFCQALGCDDSCEASYNMNECLYEHILLQGEVMGRLLEHDEP